MFKTFDGTTFGAETAVPVSFQNLDTPGAAVLNNILYVFCRGPGSDEPGNSHRFWFAAHDANLWQGAIVPNTPGCIGNPGAAVFEQKMYVLHQAPNSQFLYKTYNGQAWSPDASVPNTSGISAGPAAVAFSMWSVPGLCNLVIRVPGPARGRDESLGLLAARPQVVGAG